MVMPTSGYRRVLGNEESDYAVAWWTETDHGYVRSARDARNAITTSRALRAVDAEQRAQFFANLPEHRLEPSTGNLIPLETRPW